MKACHVFQRLLDLLCDEVRLVPSLSPITEQSGLTAATPQFKGPKPNRRNLLMAFALSDSQQTTITVQAVDKKGNPAVLDGVPEWSTDNTDVLALAPAADGLSCLVSAVGPLGTGTVTMKADAELGDGVTPIVGTLEITVNAGQAATVTLDASTPVEQP